MGEDLLDQVTEATGLPLDLISDELKVLLEASGVPLDRLSLEDLRVVLADYVQDVLLSAKARHGS